MLLGGLVIRVRRLMPLGEPRVPKPSGPKPTPLGEPRVPGRRLSTGPRLSGPWLPVALGLGVPPRELPLRAAPKQHLSAKHPMARRRAALPQGLKAPRRLPPGESHLAAVGLVPRQHRGEPRAPRVQLRTAPRLAAPRTAPKPHLSAPPPTASHPVGQPLPKARHPNVPRPPLRPCRRMLPPSCGPPPGPFLPAPLSIRSP